ncbi:MAG TPA: VIT domain-containing protein [Gemmataceae bacterium]|nr:VIT domain-containing protein [Gemmataceae bacterium]
MDCEQAMLLISAQIDREIEPEQQALLEAHLRICAGCRTTRDAFRLQDEELRRSFAERRQAAAEVAQRVRASLPGAAPRVVPMEEHADETDVGPLLRRVGLALGAAAVLAIIALLLYQFQANRQPPPVGVPMPPLAVPPAAAHKPEVPIPGEHLTARRRPVVPPSAPLAVGESLQTKAGERRRITLPDGSVLYLNQNTSVKLAADRELTLESGEVYVEAAPRPPETAPPFLVKSPRREVKAVGTKFAVRTDANGTGVLVTQGLVSVSGASQLRRGEFLPPDGTAPVPAPRVSHLLDWTRDLMAHAESPLVPASKYAGGALIAIDPSGQEAKLSLRKYHIDVHIEDGFARTTIDQTYFNHEPQRLEGTFYFPLPPDASLSRLAMYVDGNLMEGGMVERDYGRAVYEEIVYSQRDPALLEWVDGSTFKMRVFPLEGHQEKRIILSYTQKLPALYGRMQYRFPAGHSLDVVRDWSFHARIKNGADIGWSCDSHTLRATKDGADLLLDASARQVKVDRDVQLSFFDPRSAQDEQPRFSSFDHEGARYLMLRYRPRLPGSGVQKAVNPRNWVFLFESSGDRDPLLARAQIDIIQTLLQHIEHRDTFAVLTAGTRVHSLFPEPQPATPENIQAAIEFLERSHLIGALDLGSALEAAESFVKVSSLEPTTEHYLVHVGSGVATLGERREDGLVKRLPEGVRYVGVGVGKRWARGFMKAAAERTAGHFTQINPDEPIAWRAFDLYATLNTPRLHDVKVVDSAERISFLSYANSLSQGEELCAIARIEAGEPMPESVIIGGTLDGQPFRKEVPVKEVAGGAGYLPRTWAKLEIDRLLAEDALRHKNRIVALSKAMYVMTPFTSLLVLENEQMYAQYKVDRGRKDHWAIYPCPPKIPVVYEPDPLQPVDPRSVPSASKPPANQVLQTVLIRVPPRFLTWPGQDDPYGSQQVLTAANLYQRSQALQALGRLARDKAEPLGLITGEPLTRLGVEGLEREYDAYAAARLAPAAFPESDLRGFLGDLRNYRLGPGKQQRRGPLSSAPSPGWRGSPVEWSERTALAFSLDDSRSVLLPPDGYFWLRDVSIGQPLAILSDAKARSRAHLNAIPEPAVLGIRTNENFEADFSTHAPGFFSRNLPLKVKGIGRIHTRIDESMDNESTKRRSAQGLVPQSYGRPAFRGDGRLFTDLVAYAPGMNTTSADIRATLEAEAVPDPRTLPGRIDPAARRLIEQARAAGWQKLTLGGDQDTAGLDILFDGSGRYTYERVLPLGLRERVVCDGQTLLHLYPELGVGAQRNVSRFHRAALAGLVPWLVLPAEDLARGADVECVGERTVAVSPRGAAARTADGKPVPYLRIELVFATDGPLAERRLVEMPANKVHLREQFDPDGTIRLLDADRKELTARKLILTRAAAPDLKPDTSALVVLPLPLRTREHVYQAYGLNPNKPLDLEENLCLDYLEPEQALEVFAAEYAAQQAGRAREVYRRCFHQKGDRRLGFCTLLAAAGVRVSADPELLKVLWEHRHDPLASYLALQHQAYDSLHRRWALDWGRGIGPADGLLTRLADFRDRWLRWRDGSVNQLGRSARRAEQERALEYVRRNRSSVLGLALLTLIQEYAGSDEHFYRDLAAAWRLLDDGSGLAYTSRYEHARNLWNSGRRQEARTHFRELYTKAFQKGFLPPIDSTFRAALTGNGEEADLWNELMRQTAADLIREKDRVAVVTLAWQCWQLGDQPLADYLLETALDDPIGGAARAPVAAGMPRRTTPAPRPDRMAEEQEENRVVLLAAIEYLRQTNQLARADQLLRQLLEDEKQWLQADGALAPLPGAVRGAAPGGTEDAAAPMAPVVRQPQNTEEEAKAREKLLRLAGLWRLAAQVAEQRGLTARAIACLEEALEIEYHWGPEVVHLQQVRHDYGKLLDHYQMLASALAVLKLEPEGAAGAGMAPEGAALADMGTPPPGMVILPSMGPSADLVRRTVRAADRWRALDRESGPPCQQAAKILKTLGVRELAWEYLTTPIGQRPNESAPWLGLARTLNQEGDLDLADLAYAAAFDAEPTNAQILWDRAQNLRQAGKEAEALQVLRRLADGKWQPRFNWLQAQARQQVRGSGFLP